jgi:malate dehydrogenase (oxaloacetate-decarboxylating)(NADP+)
MYLAARALANQITTDELAIGSLYPPLEKIRVVSAEIAAVVVENSYNSNIATNFPKPRDLKAYCESLMYNPFQE